MKNTKQLYHRLVKRGIINKDIQMKEVKKMFHDNTDVYICNDCIASAATKLLVDD